MPLHLCFAASFALILAARSAAAQPSQSEPAPSATTTAERPQIASPVAMRPQTTLRDEALQTPRARLPPEPTEEWYGWKLLLSDATSLVLTLALIGKSKGDVDYAVISGVGGYFVAPPLVHLAQSESRGALRSLGLRVGLPLGAGLAGAMLLGGYASLTSRDCADDSREGCGGGLAFVGGFALGSGLGVVGAIITDAATAYTRSRPQEAAAKPPFSMAATLSPQFLVAPGRVNVGLSGAF